jgi:hypothetical protein
MIDSWPLIIFLSYFTACSSGGDPTRYQRPETTNTTSFQRQDFNPIPVQMSSLDSLIAQEEVSTVSSSHDKQQELNRSLQQLIMERNRYVQDVDRAIAGYRSRIDRLLPESQPPKITPSPRVNTVRLATPPSRSETMSKSSSWNKSESNSSSSNAKHKKPMTEKN